MTGHPREQTLKAVFCLIACLTLAAADGNARTPDERGVSPDEKPQVLNLVTEPTLRYPVGCFSGWSVMSASYGWLDVSRSRLRYTVVKPEKKSAEGFDIPWKTVRGLEDIRPGGLPTVAVNNGKKFYNCMYVAEDRWGHIHTSVGSARASQNGLSGTDSLRIAMRSVDAVLDLLFGVPVRKGDSATVQALLKDYPDLAKFKNYSQKTLLHVAASSGEEGIAEILLKGGADVNARDSEGDTPFLLATAKDSKDVAAMLLANKADIEAQNNQGETSVHVAAAVGSEGMVQLLLEKGANLNVKDNAGDTPLHLAAAAGSKNVMELLLDKGADASIRNNAGNTSLRLVADHADLAQLLCRHLASCGEIRDASNRGDVEKVSALLKGDPDLVLARDDNGWTPLHWAASTGHKDVAEVLINGGAAVNSREKDGAKPSALAAKNGHPEVVEYLRQQEFIAAVHAIDEATTLLGTTNAFVLRGQAPSGVRALSTDQRQMTYATVDGRLALTLNDDFVVSEQHPVRLRLVAPTLPPGDNLRVLHGSVMAQGKDNWRVDLNDGKVAVFRAAGQSQGKEGLKDQIKGDITGQWDVSEGGQLRFAGGADSGGAWYLDRGEFQFQGGVLIGSTLVVFLNGEILSTSEWSGKCTEGTVAKVEGVDYELTGQTWAPKN